MQPNVEQLLIVPINQQRETLSNPELSKTRESRSCARKATQEHVRKPTKHWDAEKGNIEKKHKRMSRFDFTREGEAPKKTTKTHQHLKIPDVAV